MSRASKDLIHVLHVDDEPDFAELAAEFIERRNDRKMLMVRPMKNDRRFPSATTPEPAPESDN